MSDYGGPHFSAEQQRAQLHSQRHWQLLYAEEQNTKAAGRTNELVQQLVQSSLDAEARELKMLFWTRVAGIGAMLALAVSIAGLVITILVA